jgi:hypothetical protein
MRTMDEVGLHEAKQSVSALSSCKLVSVLLISEWSKLPPKGSELKEDGP